MIKIEVDSIEDLRQLLALCPTTQPVIEQWHTYLPAQTDNPNSEEGKPDETPKQEEPKKRASRSKTQEVASTEPTPPTPAEPEAPTQSTDDDLLGAPATEAPKEEKVDYEKLRATISAISDHTTRQQIKDLVGRYKKADGTACEKVPDLQVTDYGSFYAGLQKITKVV